MANLTAPKFEDTEAVEEKAPTFEETEEIVITPKFEETKPVSKKSDRLQQLEAGLKGAAHGASLGWYDEAVGIVNAATDVAIDKLFRGSLTPEQQKYVETPEFGKVYAQERDKVRKEIKALQKEHPKSFLVGEVAGTIGTALVPGKLAVQSASRIGKLITSAAGGGAIAGAGMSEQDTLEGVGIDAAKGAAVGLAMGGLGGLAGKGIKRILQKADSVELQSLGLTRNSLNKLSPEAQKKAADFSREAGILVPNAEKTLANAIQVKTEATKALVSFYKGVEDIGIKFVDEQKLARDFKTKLLATYDHADTPAARQFAEGVLEEVLKIGPRNQRAAIDLYQRIGRRVPGSKGFEKEATRFAYKIMSENIDDSLIAAGKQLKDPQMKDVYRKLSEEYKLSTNLANAAEKHHFKEAGQEAARPLFGITKDELLLGAVNPQIAGAKIAARKLKETYGNELGVIGGKMLKKGGDKAARLRELLNKGETKKVSTLLLTEQLTNGE